MQSPSMGHEPLSAPPMMPMPPPYPATAQPPQGRPNAAPTPPPPPTADSRLPWPPPPGGPPQPQSPPAEPRLSDTMDRMLRPQGLFQSPWQQPWATPPVNGGRPAGGPTPPPAAGGSYQGGGQYPAAGPVSPPAQYPPGQYGQGQYQPGADGAGQYAPGQYGPGQYGQGQLGQGQPAAGQYGPGGQFGAGQFSQGPYPPGQYGQGQYPADQYATGQYATGQYATGQYGAGFGPGGTYGPPGQYGPGGQFGPDGSPIADQKRPLTFGKITLPRSPLVPAIAVAVLVVIAVTAVLLSASNHPGSSRGTSAVGGATPTAKASASTVGTNGLTEREAAKQLSGLLAQSGADRAHVIDAVSNVQDCGNHLAQDAQIFKADAANRRTLLSQVAVMPDRSALPSNMLSDLTGGWKASAMVDDDLAKWAEAAAGHCKGGDKNNASLQASYAYDDTATQDKVAFTKLWNPLARKDGLPTYQNTQI